MARLLFNMTFMMAVGVFILTLIKSGSILVALFSTGLMFMFGFAVAFIIGFFKGMMQ